VPELEQQLRRLGAAVAFPDEPDVAGGVAERLRTGVAPRRRVGSLAIGLAAAAAAAVAVLAVPPARSAILDLLGIGGATIERVETQPRAPSGADLALGEAVDPDNVRGKVSFHVLRPEVAARVYLDRSVPGGKVSFVWAESGRRVLLSEFEGEQLPLVGKAVGPATRVEDVDVRGRPGVWLEGAAHEVVWRDRFGRVRTETRRLAGNVLLWDSSADVTFRLEGVPERARALAVARSLR